jgi:3-oxoadipate enol-lactonase
MLRTIEGTTINYWVEGRGEPVLLVHGFPLASEMWKPLAARLRDRYRLIAPDLRGHGASQESAETSMESYARDLVALLERAGENRPVVLVGLSMGGYIALEFVRRFPQCVRALVLANTRASADTEEQAATRQHTAARVLEEGSSVVAEQMRTKLFAPAAPDELRQTWYRIMAASPPVGVAAALRAMARRPDSFATLAAFERPVLIIAGEEDAIIPLEEAEAMRRASPRAELEVIRHAGHMTPVEQPDDFADAMRRFLQALPAAEPESDRPDSGA